MAEPANTLTTTKLYQDKVTVYFDEENHIYSTDKEQKKKITGVTTISNMIAKPGLTYWAANAAAMAMEKWAENGMKAEDFNQYVQQARKQHKEEADEAARLGTAVHKWAENNINGLEQDIPEEEEIKNAVFAYLMFKDRFKPDFVDAERITMSLKHNYVGTLDFTARIGKDLVLGDFKTSKVLYDTYFMETAARIMSMQEEFPELKFKAMILVRLGKDGKLEVKKSEDIKGHFEAFLGAKVLHDTYRLKKVTK